MTSNDPQIGNTRQAKVLFDLPGLLVTIANYLSASEIACLSPVNRTWLKLTGRDEIWKRLCEKRWRGKWLSWESISGQTPMNTAETTWKRHYKNVETDSKRTFITTEELCTFKWRFSYIMGPDENFRDGGQCVVFVAAVTNQRYQNLSGYQGVLLMEYGYPPLRWKISRSNQLRASPEADEGNVSSLLSFPNSSP